MNTSWLQQVLHKVLYGMAINYRRSGKPKALLPVSTVEVDGNDLLILRDAEGHTFVLVIVQCS